MKKTPAIIALVMLFNINAQNFRTNGSDIGFGSGTYNTATGNYSLNNHTTGIGNTASGYLYFI
jgi:hypothetical protein